MQKHAIRIEPPRPVYLRPVSSTIGRLTSALNMLPLLHPEIPFKRFTKPKLQEMQKVVDLYRNLLKEKEDTDNPDDLTVYLGASRPLDQLKKLWKRKEISIPSKLLSTAQHPLRHLLTAAFRADHYDPLSRTATVYNAEPGILAHELGHDVDFSRRRSKLLHLLAYIAGAPFTPLYYEAQATQIATKVLKNELDKVRGLQAIGEATPEDVAKLEKQFRRMGNILAPAYGSYVGGALASTLPVAPLVTPSIMRFIRPAGLVSDPQYVDLEGKLDRIKKLRARYPNTNDTTEATDLEKEKSANTKYANLRKLT